MNPIQLLSRPRSWLQDRATLKADIESKKSDLLAQADEQRRSAELETWQSILEEQIDECVEKSVARMRTPLGQTNIYLKAFLAVLMAVTSLYFLVATLDLPSFPGWGIVQDLTFNIGSIQFGTLFYVGLTFGWTALTLSRRYIIFLNPNKDAKAKRYTQVLQEATRDRSRLRYRVRWGSEVWLGGIPWMGIIAVLLDLALGYVLAVSFVSWVYHGPENGIIHSALIAIAQMPFGGILWFIRSVVLYGLTSPEEQALGWVKSQLEQIQEQDDTDWGKEWERLRVKRNRMLWGPLCGYLVIAVLFYSGLLGLLASSDLKWIGDIVIPVLLGLCGVCSGMFFAGMTSRALGKLEGGDTPKQRVIRARKDMKQAFWSIPVTLQALFGALAVLLLGSSYSKTDAPILGASDQQGYQDVVGLLFNYIESGEEGKERTVAFLNRRAPWLLPLIASLINPVVKWWKARHVKENEETTTTKNGATLEIEPPTELPTLEIEPTVSPSDEVATLVGDILSMVQDTGQQWTDEMGQAAQIKDALARSILELHARLTNTSLDDLYRDSQPLTGMQAEAAQRHEQLTGSIQEHLGKARAAEQSLLAARQALLGGASAAEEQASE